MILTRERTLHWRQSSKSFFNVKFALYILGSRDLELCMDSSVSVQLGTPSN